jgi:ribosomal protein S18 acetylase RimI-like enzyme
MSKVERLTEYSDELAAEMGRILTFVSSNHDGSPLSREWLEEVIKSPYHEQFVAYDDGGKVVGMATMSTVFIPSKGRNTYLEEIVVDGSCQGQGIGGKLWNAIIEWSREQGARRLEFSASGNSEKKQKAVDFYLHKGAIIHDTNFFRYELGE